LHLQPWDFFLSVCINPDQFFALVDKQFSRKTFLAKLVPGISVAGIASVFFSSRGEASLKSNATVSLVVKPDARAVSREISRGGASS